MCTTPTNKDTVTNGKFTRLLGFFLSDILCTTLYRIIYVIDAPTGPPEPIATRSEVPNRAPSPTPKAEVTSAPAKRPTSPDNYSHRSTSPLVHTMPASAFTIQVSLSRVSSPSTQQSTNGPMLNY